MDDAAVVKLRDDLALCFTADIITPIVDEAYDWGRIAAANSLSDIYAMGGAPLCALNLVAWPKKLPGEILAQVLSGAQDALSEACCMLAGGHTLHASEPMFGLAVIGLVHPDKVLRNIGAQTGDLIYLSKSLGTGVIASAAKAATASPEQIQAAVYSMSQLNAATAAAACACGVRAMTDVTGFGLLGHLKEMLGDNSALGADIYTSSRRIRARKYGSTPRRCTQ